MKTTLGVYVSPSLKLFCSNGINGVYYTVYGLKYTQIIKKNQTTTINNATNINKYGYGTMSSVGLHNPVCLGQNVVIQGIDYSEDLNGCFCAAMLIQKKI